jgi:hypothetical protein
MSNGLAWPDWWLNPARYQFSMQNLARYANPAQLRGLGLGLRSVAAELALDPDRLAVDPDRSVGAAAPQVKHIRYLAEELVGQDVTYALEPFHPSITGGQIVRTTSELLDDRQGTCLDFAISLAALCVQARIPVTLAVAVSDSAQRGAHAFVIVQESSNDDGHTPESIHSATYLRQEFHVWASAFRRRGQSIKHHLIDATPKKDKSDPGTLDNRITSTLEWLESHNGMIYTVAVQHALEALGLGEDESPFYELPPTRRDLGLTAWLPDLPLDIERFPSHQDLRSDIPLAGSTVIVGPKGTGKSTLALVHAQEAGGGRGWFLDGSDRATLLRSLASAEAQCRGTNLENDQTDHLRTLAVRARDRLARTTRPWVVVVDNADGEPGDIMDLLPVPGPGQSVIVTSVDPAWGDFGGWRAIQLARLERDDLRAADQRLALADEELLPGLIRIARHCDPGVLASSMHQEAGPRRLLSAILKTVAQRAGDPDADVGTAVTAASFMPAEEVTAGWLAEAQFGKDMERTLQTVQKAAELGLLEYSRRSLGPRDDNEMQLWMHRLVRAAVRELREETDADAGLRVLARHRQSRRPQRYSADELDELTRFLIQVAKSQRSHLYAQAAAAVMDILESRGAAAVKSAGTLAAEAQPFLDSQAEDYVDVASTCLMARARVVNHASDATPEKIKEALRFCQEGVDLTRGLDEYLLLRGRTEAMRGILLRKLASREVGPVRETILEEAIDVLWKSYEERKLALTKEEVDDKRADPTKDTLKPDPDHHVDRGWFNLGGAYVVLVELIRHSSPERLPEIITKSLWAYAGSLSLRHARPEENRSVSEDTLYTAASYWGVALALYLAAIHCPGKIDMDAIAAAAELDPVRRDQTSETLLRAAEITVSRSLEIRAEIDGPTGADTRKSRNLQTKIGLAWNTSDQDPSSRLAGLKRGLKPYLSDLDLQVSDPPTGQPAEAFTITYSSPKVEI